jgi:seryl-tRNA synthetase
MLDPRLVASQPALFRDNLIRRQGGEQMLADLDELVQQIERRKNLQAETDQLRAARNAASKEIGKLFKSGQRDAANARREQVRQDGQRLDELEDARKVCLAREQELLLRLPNLIDDDIPTGASEEDNLLVRSGGEPASMDFTPRSHDELGAELGIIDMERAAKLAGARFSVLSGLGARLERALINFFLDEAAEAGYHEVMVPYIVSRSVVTGTGQLPKFEEDLFRLTDKVNGEDAFLIPTAEVPVTNLHRDEVIDPDALPIRYAGFTPCFRAEAGSHGRDTRGLIRQHQFHKVELVHITTPEQSKAEHERLTAHVESLLQKLGLPYRVMLLSSGDIGFSAQRCYDLEVWLPGQGAYREISSCSNCGDFQARRMKTRFKPDGAKKTVICHTLNGSGLAVGRALVAVLENYQQADGSIVVPEVLRSYMGVDRIGKPA